MSNPFWDKHKSRMDIFGRMRVFGVVVIAVAFVAVLAVVIGAATWAIESRNCHYAEQKYHHATHYDFMAKCYVDIGGRSFPLNQVRPVLVAR